MKNSNIKTAIYLYVIITCSFNHESLLRQHIGGAIIDKSSNIYHLVDDDPTIKRRWIIAKCWYKKILNYYLYTRSINFSEIIFKNWKIRKLFLKNKKLGK